MKKVVVYTQDGCRPCEEEKLWLKDKEIPFEERNIRKNEQYLQEIISIGASATPATVIEDENGRETIFGFDQPQLVQKLGL